MTLRYSVALLLLLALLVSSSAVPGQTPAERDFKATLLGTGIPVPQPERSGPATLVEAGRRHLTLVDLFNENVSHCESHGISDKGTVTHHQYVLFRRD